MGNRTSSGAAAGLGSGISAEPVSTGSIPSQHGQLPDRRFQTAPALHPNMQMLSSQSGAPGAPQQGSPNPYLTPSVVGGGSAGAAGGSSGSSGGGRQQLTPQQLEAQIQGLLRNYLPKETDASRITRDQFHCALQLSHEVGLHVVSRTPLGDRLFSVLETRAPSSAVSEEILVKTLATLYSGSDAERLQLTLDCYDLGRKGFVKREELVAAFLESWLCAWKMMGEKLKLRKYATAADGGGSSSGYYGHQHGAELPTSGDLLNFANKNKEKFREKCESVIDASGALGNVIVKDQLMTIFGGGSSAAGGSSAGSRATAKNIDITARVGADSVVVLCGFARANKGGGALGAGGTTMPWIGGSPMGGGGSLAPGRGG